MSHLTQIAMANHVSSKTNAVLLIRKKKYPTHFPPTKSFPQIYCSPYYSLSLSSSSHPCFFHCCVSPTELLWAHMVPSATDLLHSRAMFIKETRESASYGLSHITYSIPPEAEARHQSKHTQNPLADAYELSLSRCKIRLSFHMRPMNQLQEIK